MILNILVLVGIVLIVVAIVAYNSKRQVLPTCDHIHDEHVVDTPVATPTAIFSENVAAAPETGSFEYTKETVTNDTGGYSPPTS